MAQNILGGAVKSEKLLDSFCEYCVDHPDERFWQALRNWSEAEFILAVGVVEHSCYKATDEIKIVNHDTFYRNGRNKFDPGSEDA